MWSGRERITSKIKTVSHLYIKRIYNSYKMRLSKRRHISRKFLCKSNNKLFHIYSYNKNTCISKVLENSPVRI